MKIEQAYSILEKISETAGSRLYRARSSETGESVIIKYLSLDNPTTADRARFGHEFEIIRTVDCPGIVKTYDLVDEGSEIAIVMEDFNGIPLNSLLRINRFSAESFLPVAEKIANTLGILHEKGIIHRDIKPHNILLNSKTAEVKIADFGISSRLAQGAAGVRIRKLEGTIAYISPEQTGRINQPVDFRTDFYSLGVTFYEMLTGRLPFESEDPLEIIHAHLAKEPVSVYDLLPSVPRVISDIVMKLMAKRAEDRYSGGFSLEHDLRVCRLSLENKGVIDSFELGEAGIQTGFAMTSRIVGREKEKAQLMEAVDRVSAGGVEVVFITGEAGAGKTSLVNEIMRPVIASGGFFTHGKFDSFKRDVPYSSIIQAFLSLIRHLLPHGERYLQTWKNRILSAVGQNGRVLTDMMPLAELIIGRQSAVPDLDPEEARNRFNYVLKGFIKCFASESKPLVLFFDDTQWIDPASLDFLNGFLNDRSVRNTLVIAAYRSADAAGDENFTGVISTLSGAGVKVTTIPINPLGTDGIEEILADVFRKGDILSHDVVSLIKEKTNGNPFFVSQFIKSLFEEKLVAYDRYKGWTCDLKALSGMKVTSNVIELMAERISKLPDAAREMLKIGACIGDRFDLQTISVITKKPAEDILDSLNAAVNDGYLKFVDNIYSFYHDRILDAAYSLIPEAARCELHYRIGRAELDLAGGEKLFQKIFYIVNQLNRGIPSVKDKGEIFLISEINRSAGDKAKESSAYASAAKYFRTSFDLAGDSIWKDDYIYSYTLCMDLAECEYLSGRFHEAEDIFARVLEQTADPYDRAAVHNKLALLYTSMNKPATAVAEGIKGLAMLGVKIPQRPGKLRVVKEILKYFMLMRGKKISDIYDLPEMKDRGKLLALSILNNIGTAAYYINPDQFAIIVFTAVNICIKYGNCRHSSFAYMAFGSIISTAFKKHDAAYTLGLVSMRLNEKFDAVKYKCRTNFSFAYFIQGWIKHVKENYRYFIEGYRYGIESGDHIFSGHCVNNLFFHKLFAGHNLDEAFIEYSRYASLVKGLIDPFIVSNFVDNERFYLNLKGKTPSRDSLNGDGYDEIQREEGIIAGANLMELFTFILIKIKIAFYYGRYVDAYNLAERLNIYLQIPIGSLYLPEFHFYQSLSIGAAWDSLSPKEKKQARKRLRYNLKLFKMLSDKNESNFLHKYCFLQGEYSVLMNRQLKAIDFLHRAIKLSKENGFTQDAAIFNMRAASFYLSRGQNDLGDYHMIKSYKFFQKWGADRVCEYLLENNPHLVHKRTDSVMNDKRSNTITSTANSNDMLDISTVIKASQAISGEIRIEKLLSTLMNIIMENAGAQKGAIIFERDRSLFVEASASIDGIVQVKGNQITEETEFLPNSMINYVNKTGETLVLDDASNYPLFLNDKYITKHSPKSVLCLPFTAKGDARAMLYLENNLITGGFTSDRIQLLKILLSQAAISIENARLVSVEMQNAALENEIMMARNIQSALLPERLPATDKIEAAYRYIPMMGVGGDFISVKNWHDSDLVGLFICDVSGHGISAAFTATMVSMALDFIWKDSVDSPKNILNGIKKLLDGKMAGNFFTAIICVIDMKSRTVATCNAGHPPMIHMSKSGASQYIKVKGRMINENFESTHEEHLFKMEPGDRLVLYTDGITEAYAPDGSMLGDDDRHFLNWIRGLSDSSPTADDLCTKIFSGVTAYTGKDSVDDDVTILAAEFF